MEKAGKFYTHIKVYTLQPIDGDWNRGPPFNLCVPSENLLVPTNSCWLVISHHPPIQTIKPNAFAKLIKEVEAFIEFQVSL